MMSNSAIYSAIDAAAVTKSDTTVYDPPIRALVVGTEGDIKVRMVSGNDVTLTSASGILPLQVDMVYSTGTTASGITALY